MRILTALLVVVAACKGKPAKAPPKDAAAISATELALARDAAVDAAPKAARPEHAVWSLVDNRHTAHRYVAGELVLDARGVGFARFARFGMPRWQWQLGATRGGERAAIADRAASLELPLIPEQGAVKQLTARVHVDDKLSLEVRVNGKKPDKASRVPLEPGWQTIAIPVEPTAFVPGENILSMQTTGTGKGKLALSWLRAGASHPSGDEDPLAAVTFDATGDAIELADHASVVWYATIPEGAHLVAEVAAPCFVEVGARAGDASFVGGLLGGDQDRVDLTAVAGKTVRLSLMTRDCPRARISQPRVTIHGPKAAPLPAAEPPRIVVLWRVARLRADPGFEELARASTVFRQFAWVDFDRAELGKVVASRAKLQAVLMTDVTIETLLARFDLERDGPMFLFADTSRDPAPQLKRVIEQFKSWDVWDRTMLIVADANELAIHDPARYPNGTIVEEGAEAADLLPTILAALGHADAAAPGTSLAALAQGIGRGWPRPSYASNDGTHLLRNGRWSIRVAGTGVPLVNDAVADPGGALDLASVRPIERRMLTDSLGLFLALRTQWKKSEWGAVSNLSPAGARALDEAAAP